MRKMLALVLLLTSFPIWACWHVEGSFTVNGKTIKIAQKFLHDKSYSFQNQQMIVNIKMPSKFDRPQELIGKKDFHMVEIQFNEKNGLNLKEISQGKMIVKTNSPAVMTKEDPHTKELTVVELNIKHI